MEQEDPSGGVHGDPMAWRSSWDREPFDSFHEEREETRRRTGFLYDRGTERHREGTFKEDGRYGPGFNPPRSIGRKQELSDIPHELRSEILGGLSLHERTKVQRVSREFKGQAKSVSTMAKEIIASQFESHVYQPFLEESGSEYEYQEWCAFVIVKALNQFFDGLDIPISAKWMGYGDINISSNTILRSGITSYDLECDIDLFVIIYSISIRSRYEKPEEMRLTVSDDPDARVSSDYRESYPLLNIFLRQLAIMRGYELDKKDADRIYSGTIQ